ncbi:FecR family protein [Chitinophaga skermanii]|uniref:FecR family protein n=1 Tax=Chitinophaga skermanii TaxID=331697 RepID=A0A327QSN2_9BACT|nr:FecR domain-containing protein [Chitinophaga skermanii]RAJ06958.1 FecR family protein [Chitinophaga skermanii]
MRKRRSIRPSTVIIICSLLALAVALVLKYKSSTSPVTKFVDEHGQEIISFTSHENVSYPIHRPQKNHTQQFFHISSKEMAVLPHSSAIPLWGTLRVPAGKQFKIVLADSTLIWLNAETTIRFPYGTPQQFREVFIEGEAFVQPSLREQPFIMHAGYVNIKMDSGMCNINTYTTGITEVAMLAGNMRISNGQQVANPTAGTTIRSEHDKDLELYRLHNLYVTTWMQGQMYFEHAPLKQLVAPVKRWYNTAMIFDDLRLEKETFSATLDITEPLDSFLLDLTKTTPIKTYKEDGIIHIARK